MSTHPSALRTLIMIALLSALSGCGGESDTSTPPPPPPPGNTPLLFNVRLAGLLDGNSQGWEQSRDVVRDEAGNIYVVGGTTSADFPTTAGSLDTTFGTGGAELGSQGPSDAFVTKLDSNGNIIWSTYLGGPNYDRAYAVEIDSAHNVYIAGRAGRGFPTTAGAVQTAFAGDSAPSIYGSQDGFVAKLSADGTRLIWATYFGDSGLGVIRDLDVDAAGRAHVVLNRASSSDMDRFVTATAPQKTRRGATDTFYARLSSTGAAVEFGTYIGATETTPSAAEPSVRVLDDGTAFVVTTDRGADAPVTPNAYQGAYRGNGDLLVAKFSPIGDLVFCTYLGGSGEEAIETHELEIDPSGNLLIASATNSTNYPVTDSSTLRANGTFDVAISVLSTDGRTLLFSTLIGGSGNDNPEGIGTDATGNIYVTGNTTSVDLPVTNGALSSTHIAGELEGLLLVFSSALVPKYVSYDGIPSQFGNRSMTVGSNEWTVVGTTWRMNPFPATAGQDSTINGPDGGFFRVLAPGR